MTRIKKNRKVYCGILITVLVLLSIVFIVMRYRKYNPYLIQQRVFAMESSITARELEQMGYIDITDILQTENKEITKFLYRAERKQNAILYTFQMENEELYVRVFYSNPKLNKIISLRYYPKKQGVLAPDLRYSNTAKKLESDNMVTIILVNVLNSFLPMNEQILQDEVLYSYYLDK